MARESESLWRTETWLQEGDQLRRPMSGKKLTLEEFEEQKEANVEYIVYKLFERTYSDGKGGRKGWRQQ